MSLPEAIYVAFEVFPKPKGASTHILSMIHALKKEFSSVLLLTLGYADMPSIQQEDNIIIKRFKAIHPNMLKRAMYFSNFVAQQLLSNAKDARLIVFRDPFSGIGVLKSGVDIPAIYEVNAMPSLELVYTYPQFATNFALQQKIKFMEQQCLTHAKKILTVSDLTGRFIKENYSILEDRITTLPNTTHPMFFERQPDKLKDCTRIGYYGSLHPWQGVDLAVKAFSLIAKDFPDLKLEIVTGDKKRFRHGLQRLIHKSGLKERVILLPPEDITGISKWMDGLCFTLAPLSETPRNTLQGACPLKVIESMAAGVPIIASNIAINRALITDHEQGLLFEPDNPRALSATMSLVLKDIDLRNKMAMSARAKAIIKFAPHIIHNNLQQLFRQISR